MYDHPETIPNLIFFYAILSILPSSRYMVKYNPGAVTESSGEQSLRGALRLCLYFGYHFNVTVLYYIANINLILNYHITVT